MIDIKITEYLGKDEQGNRKFVVLLPPEQPFDENGNKDTIQIAHDYVRFSNKVSIPQERNKQTGEYPYKEEIGAVNWVSGITADVTIGIKEMFDIVLPLLNSHPYLQKEHFKDRTHIEDDIYYTQRGLDKPRWKAGDSYPAYAYNAGVVQFTDPKDGIVKIAIRRTGDKHYDIISLSLYNHIKDILRLVRDKWEIEEDKIRKDEKI